MKIKELLINAQEIVGASQKDLYFMICLFCIRGYLCEPFVCKIYSFMRCSRLQKIIWRRTRYLLTGVPNYFQCTAWLTSAGIIVWLIHLQVCSTVCVFKEEKKEEEKDCLGATFIWSFIVTAPIRRAPHDTFLKKCLFALRGVYFVQILTKWTRLKILFLKKGVLFF